MSSTHSRSRVTIAALLALLLALAFTAYAQRPAYAAGYSYITTIGGAQLVYACESGSTVKVKVVPTTNFAGYQYRVRLSSGLNYKTSAWAAYNKTTPIYVAITSPSTASSVLVEYSMNDGVGAGDSGKAAIYKSVIPNC